jgi:hypothetical protein
MIQVPNPKTNFQVPRSKFQDPNSKIQISRSKFQIQDPSSKFQDPSSLTLLVETKGEDGDLFTSFHVAPPILNTEL